MKNPWLSFWLSAVNQAAGAAQGFWFAEAQRQQHAFLRQMAKAWNLPSPPRRESEKPKRK
jgi:hypothetical protein